ncbi:biofilm regulation protein kinase SiaB [Tepidiphilus margaritifer]|uniref:biofilm regulation protein kinase SiaB n=1 Tax=Tepidiphilus margaritifer TaxID=203471 RepID=UPI000418C3A1|nr:biofilm regulation protein kinase SiaB [Tepidiphilus margaritifer]
MLDIDFLDLRELLHSHRILLCFNGPISRSLIEEIGLALKNYLDAEHAHPGAAMDVFGAYVEMTQNIRHYAIRKRYGETESAATILVAIDEEGGYLIQAGNVIEAEDAPLLLERIARLATMDSSELKRAYKEQLRRPVTPGASSGAGLGLIDIARKARRPLCATQRPLGGGKTFFSLRAIL